MQVIDTTQSSETTPVPLYSAKPGRVVCYADLDGQKNYYIVPKWNKLEADHICVPHGKRMLINLETGRVVFKNELLMVYLTSCTAEVYLRRA